MCAIIGVLGNNLPDKEKFIKARDTMTHRGPDDAGVYYVPEEEIALGHRRLSIIDLSPLGRQPFLSADGRFSIVFNGEIYNYKELKKELKGFYDFKTETDTEVLLASYIKWKEKSLSKINGMFAFAIWDREKKELFVARDRLGIKPLYFSTYKNNFYFASEIKGILEASKIPRKLNKQSLLDYLSYRYPLGDKTFFENIKPLLPGHYAFIKARKEPQITEYWELPIVHNEVDAGEDEVLQKTEDLLKEAVRSHMMSDVPLGAYLSGGLDSSALVAFMAEISGKPVKTFSVGFEEDGFNEFEYARIVADHLKTEHHEIILSSENYKELMPEVIAFKDAPLHVPNEVPLYSLSKELKKHITVVLSGEGADELFGGYGRIFRSGYDLERINTVKHPVFNNSSEKNEYEILIGNLKEKYGSKLPNNSVDLLLSQYPYSKPDDIKQLLNPQLFEISENSIVNKSFFEEQFKHLSVLHPTEQLMHFFQRAHLLGILGRLDNAAMAASVEGRVPYIDHNIVEYVSALPLKYKLRWKSEEDEKLAHKLNSDQISDVYDITKYLLRKISSKYLPTKIAYRKKVGFPVPVDSWFGSELNDYAKSLLLSKDARCRPLFNEDTLSRWIDSDNTISPRGRNIWSLLNIELWMREFSIAL